jgi:adenine-specific DNA-methyltransferase
MLVDPINKRVIRADDTLPFGEAPNLDLKIDGYNVAWPIRTDLSEGNWGISNTRLNTLISKGYVALGRYDEKRKTWGISYLSEKPQQQIETGELKVIGYDEQRNVVDVEYADAQEKQIKTVWHRNTHDAGAYGSDLVSHIIGRSRAFTFPKSLYAVRDAISVVVKNNPSALIG